MAKDMTVQQLEDAAKAEAVKAKEAANEAAKAETKEAAEKAAKKALEAAEAAAKLITQLEEKKAAEAEKNAPVSAETPGSHAPVVDPEKEEAQRKREHAMELVPYQLFRDGDRYKDDVAVFVNGKNVLIKRGEPVMLPRYIVEVVENSLKQDSQTEAMMSRLVEEYERNTKEKTQPYGG